MAETKIEWADYTFNPWIGCQKVAPGCTHCYAESFARRYNKAAWGPNGTRVKTSEANWRKPIKWNQISETAADMFEAVKAERPDEVAWGRYHYHRPRVFCASLADVFEDWQGPIVNSDGVQLRYDWDDGDGPDFYPSGSKFDDLPLATMGDLRRELFDLIDYTPHLDWLLLTKRPENVRRMLVPHSLRAVPGHVRQNEGDGYRVKCRENLWLGTSVSDQATADKNIPELLKLRDLAPVLFLSIEPLLGPVDLRHVQHDGTVEIDALNGDHGVYRPLQARSDKHIDWIIVGGESGPGARPMHPDWARSIRDQCQAAGVPFFFKQWGEWELFYDRERDDPDWRNVPRESPSVCRVNAAGGSGFHGERVVYFKRVGKKSAGRLLDGREWNEFPTREPLTAQKP